MFCPNCQFYHPSIPQEPCPKCHARTTAVYDNGRKIFPVSKEYDLEGPDPFPTFEPRDGEEMSVNMPGEGKVRFRVEHQGNQIILHRIPDTVTYRTIVDYTVDGGSFDLAKCKVCTLEWVIPFRTIDSMACPYCKQGEELREALKANLDLGEKVNNRWPEAAAYVACDHECACERRLLEKGLMEVREKL